MKDNSNLLLNLYKNIILYFNPLNVFKNSIKYNEKKDILKIKNKKIVLKNKKLLLFSIGKSSLQMAEGIRQILGKRIIKGLIITNLKVKRKKIDNMEISIGNHPLPDENSLNSGRKIYNMLSGTGKDNIVIFLISGGGSDMMVYPEDNINLKDYIEVARILKKCGADIGDINTIRKKIDRVKGGKLRLISRAEKFVNILFSDVPTCGDDLKFIASGPVFKDDTTFKDAHEILLKYKIENEVPQSVRNFIEKNIHRQNRIDKKIFKNDISFLLARNKDVQKFAGNYLKDRGFKIVFLKRVIKYEVNKEKKYILKKIFKNLNKRKIAIIGGGEPTVKVNTKSPGEGGRMSYLSLLVLKELLKRKIKNVSFLLAGTDGIDGNSDIAGGVIDMSQVEGRIRISEIEKYLENFDSAKFLKKYGLALKTGYTGINLADILVFLIK